MLRFREFSVLVFLLGLVGWAPAQQIMLDDFNSPPQFAADVDLSPQLNVWIPTKFNNGTTVGTTTTVQGNTCFKYMDWDSDRVNGVYKIYTNAFPSSGQYRIRIRLRIYDTYYQGTIGSYVNFALGYKVNGTHRSPGGDITPNPIPANEHVLIPQGYLTNSDDNGKDFIEITSQPFSANAGDNLRVIFTSNPNFSSHHTINNTTSYLILEDLRLDTQTVPVGLSDWSLD